MNENELLGFDPMSIKTQYDDIDNSYDESDYYEHDAWYEEYEKIMEKRHINNCIKKSRILLDEPRIYLAGKINRYDWRVPIVGYRCGGLMGGDDVDITKYRVEYFCENEDKSNFKIATITGPWFLSCDHGCYHGENSHGLGINKLGCPDALGDHYSEKEVYNICLKQIDNSDLIFAYIDDETCYGSIYEISYAVSRGKYVVIIFANKKLMSDMWFMCQGADIVDVLNHGQSIKSKFDEILLNKIIE